MKPLTPEQEAQMHRALWRKSLYEFAKAAWPQVEPTADYVDNWHFKVVCDQIQKTFESPGMNTLVNIPPGTAKPVWAESSVVEAIKGRVPLRAIVVGDEVLTHKGRFRKVQAVHKQGVLPMLEITTAYGRVLKVAYDHPVLTTRGWISADQLKESDTLAVVHPSVDFGTQTTSAEEARILGYLIGDGCVKYSAAQFTNADPETLLDFEQCARTLDFEVSETKVRNTTVLSLRGGLSQKLGIPKADVKGQRGPVRTWLDDHNLSGACSYSKTVPPAVLSGNSDVVLNFLAAYWACDGGIEDRRDLPRSGRVGQKVNAVRVSACSVSEHLLRGVQHLLSRLGMHFRLYSKTRNFISKRQGKTYKAWYVDAADQDTAAKFVRLVGPYMRHEKRTRAGGLVRTKFDSVLSADRIRTIAPTQDAECLCLTVEEDSSFTAEDLAVHNSLVTSVFAPAWRWIDNPGWRAIYASANPRVSMRDSIKCRDLLESDWYQKTFKPDWKLSDDQNAKGYFKNSKSGFRLAVSVGSKITGDRSSCLLVDDPLDASDAMSKPTRDACIQWYSQAFQNRLTDMANGNRIVIMQRLHEEDLSGYILEQGDWNHVCLPMEYEPERAHPDDPRREAGELLFPARFPKSVLTRELKTLGADGYAGQMQQRPVAAGGSMFKTEWWRFHGFEKKQRPPGCTDLPPVPTPLNYERVIVSLDAAFKDTKTSDYVVFTVWGRLNSSRYLLDVVRGQFSFTETCNQFRYLKAKWPSARTYLVEDKANGSAIIDTLGREIQGIVPVNPEGGKEARAYAVQPQVEAGNVFLPEGADYLSAFVNEFSSFPRSRNDDQVDSSTQALLYLGESDALRRAKLLSTL